MEERNIFSEIAFSNVDESITAEDLNMYLGENKYTPLLWAAKLNKDNWIKFLIDKSNINTKDFHLNNLFHLFAENNSFYPDIIKNEIACYLCQEQNDEKQTPLAVACREGSLETATKLIEMSPSVVNIPDIKGYNPGHIAIVNNNPKILKLLLDNDLDLEYLVEGRSLLDFCYDLCAFDCEPILVNSIFDKDKGLILQGHAKRLGVGKIIEQAIKENRINIIKSIIFMLPENEIQISSQDNIWAYAIHLYYQRNENFELIISSFIYGNKIKDLSIKPIASIFVTEICRTPGKIDVLDLFDKNSKASFDVRDSDGNTGLMLTIPHTTESNHLMFDFMLNKNKNILRNKNNDGKTVFDLANDLKCTYAQNVFKVMFKNYL